MAGVIIIPENGRGAWPVRGIGGTLALDGSKPGEFYRAPSNVSAVQQPGAIAARLVKANLDVHLDDYAVYHAVKAIQRRTGALPQDGMFGPVTAGAVRVFQREHGLVVDGVVGAATTMVMWKGLIVNAARRINPESTNLGFIAGGQVRFESRFDPGAVGWSDPNDVGLGQINGPQNKGISLEDRLAPETCLPYVVAKVNANLLAFPRQERDAIAAYNLGINGARDWVSLNRPQIYKPRVGEARDVPAYIDAVLAAAEFVNTRLPVVGAA